MKLRSKVILTSAAALASLAMAAYTLITLNPPDNFRPAEAEPASGLTAPASSPLTSAQQRDIRPGAAAAARRAAETATPIADQTATKSPRLNPGGTAQHPPTAPPIITAVAFDPVSGQRAETKGYHPKLPALRNFPTSTASAMSSSGSAPLLSSSVTTPSSATPSSFPPLSSAATAGGSTTAATGESSPEATSITSARPGMAVTQPSTTAQTVTMPLDAATVDAPAPRRQGRAVLSVEMQRLRAQLGWRAYDEWVRTQAAQGGFDEKQTE